jgi:diadenosine tetraphosphatase ApaH/serine/threonine PP2A family protein phosphatase
LRTEGGQETCESLPLSQNGPVTLGPERMILNPGSVGQPRDGDPQSSYILLDTEPLVAEHRRVPYPVEETQAKMIKYDLPLRLVLWLGYGW